MDTDNIIKEAKLRYSHNAAKQYLKEKYESKLVIAEQGGLWRASPEFISFLHTFTTEQVIAIDLFGNPVQFNRNELLLKLSELYQNVMQEWFAEYSTTEYRR